MADEQVSQAAEGFRQAIERARLYGVDHPQAREAIDRVWQPLAGAVRAHGSVSLRSGVDGLRWQGQLLYAEDEDKEGLGRLLHREGIHSLTFHPSASRKELARLFDVLRVNLSLPEHEEETMESLLWQARMHGIGFRAVAALMEAEAISGDALRFLRDQDHSAVRALVEGIDTPELDELSAERAAQALPDDELVRAVDRAGDALDVVAGEDGAWDEEQLPPGEWELRFAESLADDADAVAAMRSEAALEQPGDQVRRASELLFRVARARRAELRPGDALRMAEGALSEVMRQRDAFALAALIDTATIQRDAAQDPQIRSRIERFLDTATHPITIARLLAEAGPGADPAAVDRLVEMLDDAAIRALVEWAFGEGAGETGSAAQGRWLATTLGEVAARRARRWLWDEHTPPELLVPAAQLLRGRDGEEERAARPALLDHPAGRIPEITLQWYADTGIPTAEAARVLACLEDRRPRVRQAAALALATAPPSAAADWFRRRLSADALMARQDDLAESLCVSFGTVMKGSAVGPLRQLLDRRVGLFAGQKAGDLLRCAAMGLAATGSADARQALEEGSKSWVGARGQACKDALAAMDAGGPGRRRR
ncbi:MAG: hypothetical protein H6742_03950 [Alphaproteobacteria bacterium]|nr:hypothetical protein [Alphaproteobacteria bacterium]